MGGAGGRGRLSAETLSSFSDTEQTCSDLLARQVQLVQLHSCQIEFLSSCAQVHIERFMGAYKELSLSLEKTGSVDEKVMVLKLALLSCQLYSNVLFPLNFGSKS